MNDSSLNTYSEEYKQKCLARYKERRATLRKLYLQDPSGRKNKRELDEFIGQLSEMNKRTFRKLWADWKSGKIVD